MSPVQLAIIKLDELEDILSSNLGECSEFNVLLNEVIYFKMKFEKLLEVSNE